MDQVPAFTLGWACSELQESLGASQPCASSKSACEEDLPFGPTRAQSTTASTDASSVSTASAATSSADWQSPSGVLIFVDFDDTIFPTSWLDLKPRFQAWKSGQCDAAGVLDEADKARLADLDQAARSFLISASQLGKVVCVTLAQRNWPLRTLEAFLPRVAAAWRELDIEVRHAVEERLETRRASRPFSGVAGCGKDVLFNAEELWMVHGAIATARKQRAMRRAMQQFYGKRASWKNVLSFGDGPHERQALWDAAFERINPASSKTGVSKPFRVKTMRMLQEPNCVELCEELQQLQAWLPLIVGMDSDLDETWESDEEACMELQRRLEEALAVAREA